MWNFPIESWFLRECLIFEQGLPIDVPPDDDLPSTCVLGEYDSSLSFRLSSKVIDDVIGGEIPYIILGRPMEGKHTWFSWSQSRL